MSRLIRLSIGIENLEDIVWDLDQALQSARPFSYGTKSRSVEWEPEQI